MVWCLGAEYSSLSSVADCESLAEKPLKSGLTLSADALRLIIRRTEEVKYGIKELSQLRQRTG